MLNKSDFVKIKGAFLYPLIVICAGLFIAQLIGTLQVWLSNIDLHQSLSLLKSNGYFIVPNHLIIDQLRRFTPAFIGGLFFTFTVGAGLSVFAFGMVWCWLCLLHKNKIMGLIFILLWTGCIGAVNRKGLCPVVTLYFLLIPLIILIMMMKWDRHSNRSKRTRVPWEALLSVLMLAVLWTTQMSSSMFLDIRDNLLFSNAIGTAFNDIYYRYTLYPAEVFKPLNQKLLKTCCLTGFKDREAEKRIEKLLLNRDYLRVHTAKSIDLGILEEDGALVFYHKQKPLLNTTYREFMSDPNRILESVSLKSDRYGFFRRITFVGLLVGFPLVLYLFMYSLFGFFCAWATKTRTASIISSLLCFLIGVSTFAFFYGNKSTLVDKADVPSVLLSDRWQDKVSALKTIIHYKMDINPITLHPDIVNNPHVPVRYWLAKSLGLSRRGEADPDIVRLLHDSQPNVVCMALETLSRRRNKKSIDIIIHIIETTDHWYIQWYAYRALRKLGWKQTELI